MRWGVFHTDDGRTHVCPLAADDERTPMRPHELTSQCGCHPRLETLPNSALLLVHEMVH